MIYTRRFNPRPREAGDFHLAQVFAVPKGFNPRPREAGDCTHSKFFRALCLDIH